MQSFESKEIMSIEKDLATRALKFARSIIWAGSTDLAANAYSLEDHAEVHNFILKLRHKIGKYPISPTSTIDSHAVQKVFNYFERSVESFKQYSLGNCGDLAMFALLYVLQNGPININAEIFQIIEGDHHFLVIGRDPKSDPKKPETWGKNAYICDPWANKVFQASTYREHLKGFKSRFPAEAPCLFVNPNHPERKPWPRYVNSTFPFEQNKKVYLRPIRLLNTYNLRQRDNKFYLSQLVRSYHQKLHTMLTNTMQLQTELTYTYHRLASDFEKNSKECGILAKKLSLASKATAKIKLLMTEKIPADHMERYWKVKPLLNDKMHNLMFYMNALNDHTKEEHLLILKKRSYFNFFYRKPIPLTKLGAAYQTLQSSVREARARWGMRVHG